MPAPIQFARGDLIPNTQLRYLEEVARVDPKRRRALFECDCGRQIETDLNWVRFLNITSCGCFKSQLVAKKNTKHSHAIRGAKSGAYRSWQAMHQRAASHPDYKDRQVCNRWSGEQGFENFYADMGDRPDGLTIERVNNELGYEPSNCVWATYTQQNLNKSNLRRK